MSSSDDETNASWDSNEDGESSQSEGDAAGESESSDDSTDAFNAALFKHCILNFCGGDYDEEIRAALDDFDAGDGSAPEDAALPTLEALKAQLRRHARAMDAAEDGDFKEELELGLPWDLQLGSAEYLPVRQRNFLPYEESLDSCWDNFLNAFHRYSPLHATSIPLRFLRSGRLGHQANMVGNHSYQANRMVRDFKIKNVELTNDTLEKMVAKLKQKVHSVLMFRQNNLCHGGIVSVAKLLEGNPAVSELDICGNPISSLSSASSLSAVAAAHASLDFINLSHCDLGRNTRVLSTIIGCGVRYLHLTANSIDSSGATEIASLLESDPPLKCLGLDKNALTDVDAELLARALRGNTNLEVLWIRGNILSPAGVKHLFRAVFDSSNMNALSESNHKCVPYPFSELNAYQDIFRRINAGNRHANHKVKLSMVLHSKESALRYLEGVPPELMPDVLSLIQEGRDADTLRNMMYTVVRWWDMPLIFSFHSCAPQGRKRKRHSV